MPLSVQNGTTKIAAVRPVSKLPTMQSRLPTISQNKSVPQKRKSAENAPASKRQKTEAMAAPAPVAAPARKIMVANRTTTKSQGPLTRQNSAGRLGGPARGAAANNSKVAAKKPAAKAPAAAVVNKTSTTRPAPVTTKPAGKKRPAWDLKGRVADMEQTISTYLQMNEQLKSQVNTYTNQVEEEKHRNEHLSMTVAQREELTSAKNAEISKLQTEKRATEDELHKINYLKSQVEADLLTSRQETASARKENEGLQSLIDTLTSRKACLEAEIRGFKVQEENYLKSIKNHEETEVKHLEKIKSLEDLTAELREIIEDYRRKERMFETERRVLHNTIVELKGNIRVFCRVRPLLEEEQKTQEMISHLHFPDDCTLEMEKLNSSNVDETSSLRKGACGNKYEFNFDKIFSPESTQNEVFGELSQLVQSALDGYNVCIFAYGQTGSGKTFTMEGPENPDEVTEGMIPRAVSQIFETAESLKDKGWQYEFEASFLEIYNESIHDLLGSHKDDVKHEIKIVGPKSHEVTVTNLTVVKVDSPEKVHSLLKRASDHRAVAATKCNERSSRSHSVFMMKLSGSNELTEESSIGVLNLVDLAGSERLKESGSQGARLKETQAINKSLSNLGNVIMALANKDPHIPYRNSKLTYLLQNSLGGNSKTLMFVNVSPKEDSFSETLNSLRFATKVNNCNIGTAQKRSK